MLAFRTTRQTGMMARKKTSEHPLLAVKIADNRGIERMKVMEAEQ